MKQIQTCLDRYFNGQRPLSQKWRVLRLDDPSRHAILLFHYHHLVLAYDVDLNLIIKKWWEKPADKRGLDAALEYLKEREHLG